MANSETSPREIGPGLYEFEDLQPFNHRQAWTAELAADVNKQVVTVGDQDVVLLSRLRESGKPSQASSKLSAIQEVIRTGTAEVPQGRVYKTLSDLQHEIRRVSFTSPWVENSLDELERAVSEAEQRRIEEKIIRVAGYIAVRRSLWVLTRCDPKEAKDQSIRKLPLAISIARLVGVTFDTSYPDRVPARPVVSGKNGAIGWLRPKKTKHEETLRPRLLDVVEGIRSAS